MTTKEQERKALEQIKKIVDSLGEDSYVGIAFEGCFEIAETNIKNDWACSMKQSVVQAELGEATNKKIAEQALADARKMEARIKELETTIANLRQELGREEEARAAALEKMLDERKDVHIATKDGDERCCSFEKIQFFADYAPFKFINVVEKSGWTTSYKVDDLVRFEIE